LTDFSDPAVRRVRSLDDDAIRALAGVLIDCVADGASVGFMHPLGPAAAEAFWRQIAADLDAGRRAVLVGEDGGGLVGTVQLVLDQPENQPHRADLAKMLVHPRARRRGLGAALLAAAEEVARACGKSLLVLDTASNEADRLYRRGGWVPVGRIPDYALLPAGGLCDTTVFYKRL
jgi:GNAT superfamily N-acetyltransferase